MSNKIYFRFTVPLLPRNAEALTGDEIEQCHHDEDE